jgi:3-oxoacyl-[acyl-carrier-protein] synthase III
MNVDTVLLPKVENMTGLKVPVTINGTGFSVPDNIVTNEELSQVLDTSDEWIQTKTGIKERRYLNDGEITSDLCIKASEEAILNANITAQEVDAIILTTTTPDQRLPSTALVIKDAIGASRAIPIDLNQAACAGGIFSIVIGSHLLQNEHINNVLVIGAEVLSRATDPVDRSTKVFFGDAAGALVLQKAREGNGLLAWDIDSTLNNAVQIVGGGSVPLPDGETIESSQYIKMDGREVWKMATKKIPSSMRKVIQKAGLAVQDIDHFLIHQANLNIVKAALEELDVPETKTTFTVQDYANTGSASLFSVLYKALSEKRIAEGDYIVFSAIGAGFMWGSLCLKYTQNELKGC